MRREDTSSPEPLSVTHILSTVEELAARFDWDAAWTNPVIEATWTKSRSGNHFALIAAPGHNAIVLKFVSPAPAGNAGFHQDLASATAAAMKEYAALLATRPSVAASSPRPLGWGDNLAVVASEFCAGTRFTEFLRDASHIAWESPDLIERWVETAGAALAVWHTVPVSEAAKYESAFGATEFTLRRLRLGSADRRVLMQYVANTPEMVVDLYRDYGPGNALGAPDGRINVLDPPAHSQAGMRQRDAADFLFGLDMNLSGSGLTGEGVTGTDDRVVLRKAFLRGYSETSKIDLLDGSGSALLASYEAARSFGIARKRVSANSGSDGSLGRRWVSAAWAARNGALHRISATRQIHNA